MVIFTIVAHRSKVNFLVLWESTQMKKRQIIINTLCEIIIAAVFGILLVVVTAYFWQQNNSDAFYDKSVSIKSARMAT